jgi:hypothetical protein
VRPTAAVVAARQKDVRPHRQVEMCLDDLDLDAVGALAMLAVGAGRADDEHGPALAAARLVGRHCGIDGCWLRYVWFGFGVDQSRWCCLGFLASCDAMLQKAGGEDLIEVVEGGEKREREDLADNIYLCSCSSGGGEGGKVFDHVTMVVEGSREPQFLCLISERIRGLGCRMALRGTAKVGTLRKAHQLTGCRAQAPAQLQHRGMCPETENVVRGFGGGAAWRLRRCKCGLLQCAYLRELRDHRSFPTAYHAPRIG